MIEKQLSKRNSLSEIRSRARFNNWEKRGKV